jgi:hypothetical protein
MLTFKMAQLFFKASPVFYPCYIYTAGIYFTLKGYQEN